MDASLFLGLAGLAFTVFSLLYAIYITRRSKLEKLLVYEVMRPVPIAEVIKSEGAYSLKVVYERAGEEPIYVQHAVVQYVRFTNFGRVPITKGDLANADKLRIEVTGGTVLDLSLASATREVCQITIGQTKRDNGITSATVDFDFLDYLDGGLIQILSDTGSVKAALRGTIVGMPNGIRKTKDVPQFTPFPTWGCVTATIVGLLALTAAPFGYRYVTGSWESVWLLALPIAALIIPLLLFIMIVIVAEPRTEFEFPKQLFPPRWYHMRREPYFQQMSEQETEKQANVRRLRKAKHAKESVELADDEDG